MHVSFFVLSLLDKQVQKVAWPTSLSYLVCHNLVPRFNHPESEKLKAAVSMLSIDCRALLRYTFYGGLAKTHPDVLLLRVQALYSKGEVL